MANENIISSILKDTGACTFDLRDYRYDQRLAYVSMIVSLAWADGAIDQRERDLIETIASAAGEDIVRQLDSIFIQNRKFNIEQYDQWVACIDDQKLKVGLMIDMFLTTFADTICMQSETIYMKYISQKLGIGDQLYTEIRKAVEEYLNTHNQEVNYEHGLLNDRVQNATAPDDTLLNRFINNLSSLLF